MRRQLIRIAVATMLAMPAFAEVNVNINIGAPPPVIVRAPPTMLFLPDPGVYVAVGVPYDIYFISGRYYYLQGDNWFWATGYGGPWVYVVHTSLPPGLRKFKVKQLRDYRDREYRVYQVQGPGFKGKQFRADQGNGNGNGNGQGNQGNGRGNGQGKGKKG